MKFLHKNKEILNIRDIDHKCFNHDMKSKDVGPDIKRRVNWVLEQFIRTRMKKLTDDWMPRLMQEGLDYKPTDMELMQMIFDHPAYQNADQRGVAHTVPTLDVTWKSSPL